MRSRTRTHVFAQPVPLVEIGTIQGHYVQALAERSTFIVDGTQAILCTPLEYQLALQLLPATLYVPLRVSHLLAVVSVDRRSLGDLMTALRQKLFHPLGLEVASVPRYGYMLVEHQDPS
jgi:hypothetical protein